MKWLVGVLCLWGSVSAALALGEFSFVDTSDGPGKFPLVAAKPATVVVDPADWFGVARAAKDLVADVNRVTAQTPAFASDAKAAGANAVLIGTIGKSPLIDQLVKDGKIDVSQVAGRWEAYVIQVVANPLPGIASGLVIAGSDKRGTIYGIYDISEQIGVSPWYFWADVPTVHKTALYIRPGAVLGKEPAVKYRGIFLNDEAPALSGWVHEKYGEYNHLFYAQVFELILRLRGNYLWPAMWGNAFNEDDPANPQEADDFGIVMGTSHHEPMMRAQQEWKRHGTGPWNYKTNDEVLRKFWADGVTRNKNFEQITTVGMRGDGDMPMTDSEKQSDTELLERIVADQRKILAEKVNPDVTKIPQDWALYKEVQAYYEKGMRVPDDVTLLWCDDNWGNIRRLPTAAERERSGGAGVYYHFDYVGGPRNYKWINTNPIQKVWEQMNLAHNYGANRIWIVNVGDLKPMEFPIEFFLSLARDPDRWGKDNIGEFTTLWATREFGPKHAAEIADLVTRHDKYIGRRKPELLEPATFSLINYHEAERVIADYGDLLKKANAIQKDLPAEMHDAFFELVLHPIAAIAYVTDMYVAAGTNKLYAEQGRASANDEAERTKALFQKDADLSAYYNKVLAQGKWDHMMDQTHIGYTYWQQPDTNTMPAVRAVAVSDRPKMGVTVEGSETAATAGETATLPDFDIYNDPQRTIDVFNGGKAPFKFEAKASAAWIRLSRLGGTVAKDQRLLVSIDWNTAPRGTSSGTVKISGPGEDSVSVKVTAVNPAAPTKAALDGFVEADGYVSIEAADYTRNIGSGTAHWDKIVDYGRTDSGMTIFPVTADSVDIAASAPVLEYTMYLFDPGTVEVEAILGPTLNFVPGRGLRYAISFDDQPPTVVDALADDDNMKWETSVKDNARKAVTKLTVKGTGYHTLKFRMIDPGVVLTKLVVDLGGVKSSYLGPPESYHATHKTTAIGFVPGARP